MVEKVVWTNKASKTYWQIIEYLYSEFGNEVVARFVTTVHNKIELIKSNPYLFRRSTSQKNVFITVIHKRTSLTYRYRPIKKRVELLIFWGTRMNPANNPYKR
jgi:plasmid stabilization system protein ParE